MGKINKKHRIFSGIMFFIYLVMLVYFMFFAEALGRSVASASYHYNIIPFKEISRFLTYRQTLGMEAVFANLLGNIVAFVPFGLFLPGLINNRYGYLGMTFLSMDLSLFIEVSQLITKVGSFDVDDIILNTIGGVLGYFIFRMYMMYRRKNVTKNEQSKI